MARPLYKIFSKEFIFCIVLFRVKISTYSSSLCDHQVYATTWLYEIIFMMMIQGFCHFGSPHKISCLVYHSQSPVSYKFNRSPKNWRIDLINWLKTEDCNPFAVVIHHLSHKVNTYIFSFRWPKNFVLLLKFSWEI